MSRFHGLSAALLAAVTSTAAHSATIDGEPTTGRLTPVKYPSYTVLMKAEPECPEGETPRVCTTIRILEVLETGHRTTDPIAWKNVFDARKGRTDDPKAGVMQITVFKPSYTSRSDLFRIYVEATTCTEPPTGKCTTTWARTDGIKPTVPTLE